MSFKKFMLAALVFVIGSAANASVISFDDLSARTLFSSQGISNSYQGDVWSSSGNASTGWASATTVNRVSGESLTPVSGSSYAWNWSGVQSLYISFAQLTDVTGAYFANLGSSYSANASTIQLFAYDASNSLIASSSILNLTNAFQYLESDFSGVSKLEIRANAVSKWFLVDSIVLNQNPAAVPEPGTVALLGLGLLGLLAGRRRRKAD
ncbi:PEP-CTERM sorting domain-containing protein [Herbaspirillum lusitanum]|uniref:PEP-CTERM sorting domain-containing protein n=1 Tax=Herbaspirillum lusitanum TaxID=213312 RepID=A0ABW9A3H9_9BURK